MGIFNTKITQVESVAVKDASTGDTIVELSDVTLPEPEEKWIWVEGYKGTDANMQGHGNFQFELNKQYDIQNDKPINVCENGFHFGLSLKDVCNYYDIGNNNRFFKVRALVREKDFNAYGKKDAPSVPLWTVSFCTRNIIDKLAAKSIILTEELTIDEIFENTILRDMSKEYKEVAIATSCKTAIQINQAKILMGYGYSLPFSVWVVHNKKFNIAKALGSQENISMDTKAYLIMTTSSTDD
jgi:hypothetical protein